MAAREPLHAVAIEEENVKVFRLLYQNAQRLHGLAAPVFVVNQGKVLASLPHTQNHSGTKPGLL